MATKDEQGRDIHAQMGHLWQQASNRKGIYLMAVAEDEKGNAVEQQIRDAITGSRK